MDQAPARPSTTGDPEGRAAEGAPRRPDTLVVCINRRFRTDAPSCAARGSEAIADALERGIRERGIALRVVRIRCFGACSRGPTMRLAPGGAFLFEVRAEDVPALLDRFEREAGRSVGEPYPASLRFLGS